MHSSFNSSSILQITQCNNKYTYCTRDQTVRFAYVTGLWAEGKQTHVQDGPKVFDLLQFN
jgi:hypothetical protein